MKILALFIFTFLSASVMAASDCQLAFDEIKFYDQSGVVDWKQGKGLEKTHPELTTLTPEIPELMRFEVQHQGDCQLETEIKVSIYGLKGSYATGDDPHHEAHGKAPEGSEWTKNSIWKKTQNYRLSPNGPVLNFTDIPIEEVLLSVPEENWYWALRFEVEVRQKNKEQILWKKTQELPAPLVH